MSSSIERGFFKSRIKLSDDGMPSATNPNVQVLRTGNFSHPKYGNFSITPKILSELKQNFEKKVYGIDICFDYFHNSDEEAAGWPTELFLSEDGEELWAKVDWTATARKKLGEREIRYFSPDFAFKWTHPETGVTYNNVLFGGGLTNRPFVKEMAAIVASEQGGIMNEKELKELQATVLKLSEDQGALKTENEALKKKLAELAVVPPPKAADPAAAGGDDSDDIDSLKKQLAEANKKLAEFAEKQKQLEEAKKMAEQESAFNILLSEGKACAAQKDSFMKGDMTAFAKLSQPVNLEGRGSAAGGSGTGGDASKEDKILKLAEEKCKADPKLSMVEAITLAHREIK
jgi:phage I-like protein